MSSCFQFRQFSIKQEINSQKVGTDSMLLGAWTSSNFKHILDIGTGTGILALMMAQKNPDAKIFAIEPDKDSCLEASLNFANSVFSKRINPVSTSLQEFTSTEKFDLIICNPPYFENSTLSEDEARNRARHTTSLPIPDLYKKVSHLLEQQGRFNLIIPFEQESAHVKAAEKEHLYPVEILRTKREDNIFKRSLISFSNSKESMKEEAIVVKFSNNKYSKEYISITKDFYLKDLSSE